jgi:uncharacterized Ntn-hydrolase superfamily protein
VTFSVVARCASTGRFGVAVASSSPAVAARCAHARAGVGAVSTQNVTDPRLGPQGLDLMRLGASAPDAASALRATAPHLEHRQFTLIDRAGRTAWFSGARTLGTHAAAEAQDVVCAGNLLANPDVPRHMAEAFAASTGALGDRIVAAMRAGLAAGGEAGPVHSAGMLIVDAVAWPVADLRVDWHDAPIDALSELWALWRPQLDAYVARALDPDAAPSYGVPGDR